MSNRRGRSQPSEFNQAIGSRIRECRRRCGMTPNDLGRLIFYTPDAVRKMERGERMPPPEVIYQIAMISHTTTDYLISGRIHIADDAMLSLKLARDILIEVVDHSMGQFAPQDPSDEQNE